MSLEQALEKNTAALVALTAALSSKSPAFAPSDPNRSAQGNAGGAKPSVATPPLGAVAPGALPNPPATPPTLTYEAVAKVVSDFVKANGRAPAVILLEPYKVTTLVPLKDKPAELAGAYAAFTDPAKTAAAIAQAAAAAAPKA